MTTLVVALDTLVVTGYQSANGLMNLFIPTSAVVIGGLAIARVPYGRYLRGGLAASRHGGSRGDRRARRQRSSRLRRGRANVGAGSARRS